MPNTSGPYSGIVLRNSYPVMSALFAVAAISFGITYVCTRQTEFIALLVGCMLAAFICLGKLRLASSFEITEEGIDLDQGKLRVAWDRITSCAYGGYRISPELAANQRSKPVSVYFGNESLRLSLADPNSNSELYRGIWNILIVNALPNLNEPLASTFRVAAEKYGRDKVVAAGALVKKFGVKLRGRTILAVLVLFLAAIVGIVVGQGRDGFSTFLTIVSGIVLVLLVSLYLLDRLKRKDLNRGGDIVLTPQYLSLQMKNLKGSLKWSELKGLSLIPSSNHPRYLRLQVAGANIILEDCFQLPLWLLHDRAQWFRLNYESQSQPPKLGQNTSGTLLPEVEEDHNPFRPPRT